MTQKVYPGVVERMKALVADTAVLIVLMYILSAVFNSFHNVPDYVRIAAFVFVFLLYDPLLTSFFGGTIGHMIVGVRVKRASDESKNINFPAALIRYVIKAILGVISLFSVLSNDKRQAIHDFAASSIIVYAKKK